MDLGICPKLHSERILKQFQEHVAANPSDPRVAAFRQEHENSLYGFVDDADRRIRAAQRKLEKTPEENRKTVDLVRGHTPFSLDSPCGWMLINLLLLSIDSSTCHYPCDPVARHTIVSNLPRRHAHPWIPRVRV
jgi:hypothetical protein